MATGQISSDAGKAGSYDSGITGKVGPLGSGKHATISSGTNLSGNQKCATCFSTNSSMLAAYAGIVREDAAKIKAIATSFANVDKSAAAAVTQAGKKK